MLLQKYSLGLLRKTRLLQLGVRLIGVALQTLQVLNLSKKKIAKVKAQNKTLHGKVFY